MVRDKSQKLSPRNISILDLGGIYGNIDNEKLIRFNLIAYIIVYEINPNMISARWKDEMKRISLDIIWWYMITVEDFDQDFTIEERRGMS